MVKETINIKDLDLDVIYDFIENGNRANAPQKIIDYLEMMEKVRCMYRRFDKWGDKEAIVNHLVKVDGLSRYLAMKLYEQTMEYFFCSKHISKEAKINMILQKMEANTNVAMLLIENVSDASKVNKMLAEQGKLVAELPDPVDIPEELFDRPFKVYTQNPEDVGLEVQPRKELLKLIEKKLPDIPEVIKQRIIAESNSGVPVKMFDIDPRASK